MYAIEVIVHMTKYQTEIKEKALVAFDKSSGKIYALGQEAEKYENVEGITVATPFNLGKITDYNMAVAFFKYLLNKAYKEIGIRPVFKKTMGICTDRKFDEIERKVWEDCLLQSVKAKELLISEKSYEKLIEQIPLFPEITLPEVVFEMGPIDINELIRGTIDEIYDIARQQEVPIEDVTHGIDDYIKTRI